MKAQPSKTKPRPASAPEALPLVLTVPEAATVLRISRYTVARMIREGALKAVTMGMRRSVRIPRAEVLRVASGG